MIQITTDGLIWRKNVNIGYLDGEDVYMFVKDRSVKIGSFDHRSEVVGMVTEWLAERS